LKGFDKNSGFSAAAFSEELQDSRRVSIRDEEVLDTRGPLEIHSAHNEKSLVQRSNPEFR